jgi:hypothetical protein
LAERGVERVGAQRRPAARVPVVPVALGALVLGDEEVAQLGGPSEQPGVEQRAGDN